MNNNYIIPCQIGFCFIIQCENPSSRIPYFRYNWETNQEETAIGIPTRMVTPSKPVGEPETFIVGTTTYTVTRLNSEECSIIWKY